MNAELITLILKDNAKAKYNKILSDKTLANNTKMVLKLQDLMPSQEGWYYDTDKIKSISVELNEDFSDQKIRVQKILSDNNFLFVSKNKSEDNPDSKNESIYNYIFKKKIKNF